MEWWNQQNVAVHPAHDRGSSGDGEKKERKKKKRIMMKRGMMMMMMMMCLYHLRMVMDPDSTAREVAENGNDKTGQPVRRNQESDEDLLMNVDCSLL